MPLLLEIFMCSMHYIIELILIIFFMLLLKPSNWLDKYDLISYLKFQKKTYPNPISFVVKLVFDSLKSIL